MRNEYDACILHGATLQRFRALYFCVNGDRSHFPLADLPYLAVFCVIVHDVIHLRIVNFMKINFIFIGSIVTLFSIPSVVFADDASISQEVKIDRPVIQGSVFGVEEVRIYHGTNSGGSVIEAEHNFSVAFNKPAFTVTMNLYIKDTNSLVIQYDYQHDKHGRPGQLGFGLWGGDLLPSTAYRYRIMGFDVATGKSATYENDFTTAPYPYMDSGNVTAPIAPQESSPTQSITDVSVSAINPYSATFRWKTLLPSSDFLYYGKNTDSLGVGGGVPGVRKDHVVTWDTLEPNTTYYYYISAPTERSGVDVRTEIKSFKTLPTPSELNKLQNEIGVSLNDSAALKKSINTNKKSLQFYGIDAQKLLTNIEAHNANLQAVQGLLKDNNYDEALSAYDELEYFDAKLLRSSIALIGKSYAILKQVKDSRIKKELAHVTALIAEPINSGEFEDAHEALVSFNAELAKNKKLYLKKTNKNTQKNLIGALQKLREVITAEE